MICPFSFEACVWILTSKRGVRKSARTGPVQAGISPVYAPDPTSWWPEAFLNHWLCWCIENSSWFLGSEHCRVIQLLEICLSMKLHLIGWVNSQVLFDSQAVLKLWKNQRREMCCNLTGMSCYEDMFILEEQTISTMTIGDCVVYVHTIKSRFCLTVLSIGNSNNKKKSTSKQIILIFILQAEIRGTATLNDLPQLEQ